MRRARHAVDWATPRDVRVLTVDDTISFLDVARRVVETVPGFLWVGEARSGEEAVTSVQRDPPDLVIMDVRMPGIGGWDAARQIAVEAPGVAILLVSAMDADATGIDDDAASCATFARKQDFGPALLRAAVSAGRGRGTAELP